MHPIRHRSGPALHGATGGHVWSHAALGVVFTGLMGALLVSVLPLSQAFVLKALAAGVAGAVVLLGAARAHDVPVIMGMANRVTLLRGCLVLLLAAMLGEAHVAPLTVAVVTVAATAAVLDGVDGWLARRSDTASGFGARFDMETDALLILVLALLAWQWQKAGAWILLSGGLRYLFVAAGALLPWMRRSLPPSRRRRIVCVLQVAALITCLAPAVTYPASAFIAAAGLAALLLSFTIDTWWLLARARTAREVLHS